MEIRCEKNLIEIVIRIKSEDDSCFGWRHWVKFNSLDDQIVTVLNGILNSGPDIIRHILINGPIHDNPDEDNCMDIWIFVRTHKDNPLVYDISFSLYVSMGENEKRKIIDSPLGLEEAMEVAIKDCLKIMTEERKLDLQNYNVVN